MRLCSCLAFVLVVAISSTSVGFAQQQRDVRSANAIMPGCRNAIANEGHSNTAFDAYQRGICRGLVGAMFYWRKYLFFCAPEGATAGQALRIVVHFIDSHPARLHERFEDLAIDALQSAWPCKR
jgi:hypothetical protein